MPSDTGGTVEIAWTTRRRVWAAARCVNVVIAKNDEERVYAAHRSPVPS